MQSMVLGATGIVGGYIVEQLVLAGERPFALSRSPKAARDDVQWVEGDLTAPASLSFPDVTTIYCTVQAGLLAKALPGLMRPSLRRVVVFTSTSVLTKAESDIAEERELIQGWLDAERDIIAQCEAHGVEWTILRPTLIYAEGRDSNVSRLAGMIRKLGFLPLAGRGEGLRQPVHAQDLATGAIGAARSAAAAGKIYSLPGTDTVSYREMVGRIFDGLRKPRRIIVVPVALWRLGFFLARPVLPNANAAMGDRMSKDMVFDAGPAIRDFGWTAREFRPKFT